MDGQCERLALGVEEAAKALGISSRTLWTLTKKGKVPCRRVGRRVLYPVELLREWLRSGGGHGMVA
jgi:excisionase family DNA binding protein